MHNESARFTRRVRACRRSESRLAFVRRMHRRSPRRRAMRRRLLVPANRRLSCNCDSCTVIIITFGLSSAATSARGSTLAVVSWPPSSRKEASKNNSSARYTSGQAREIELIRAVLCRDFIIRLKSDAEGESPGFGLPLGDVRTSRLQRNESF